MTPRAGSVSAADRRLSRFVAREIALGTFPGAVTVVLAGGRIIHQEAQGLRAPGLSDPMQPDDLFILASMTKPVVSVVALRLMEQGRLTLDERVARWLPELAAPSVATGDPVAPGAPIPTRPARAPITVRDLLRHSSGFGYARDAPWLALAAAWTAADVEARRGPLTADETLRRLSSLPLFHEPGTHFQYGISTDVLGILLERATGHGLDRLVAEHVTEPLGMTDTGWFVPPARRARLALAFKDDPEWAESWRSYRIEHDPRLRGFCRAGSGLVSTALDYARFVAALMASRDGKALCRRLLTPASYALMVQNQIAGLGGGPMAYTGPGYGFGLGLAVRVVADAPGAAPGAMGDLLWSGTWGTSFVMDPAADRAAIIMAQCPSQRMVTRRLIRQYLFGDSGVQICAEGGPACRTRPMI